MICMNILICKVTFEMCGNVNVYDWRGVMSYHCARIIWCRDMLYVDQINIYGLFGI